MIATLRRHPVLAACVTVPVALALGLAALVGLWLQGYHIPLASGSTWFEVTKTASGEYTPAPGQPVFVVVIGSDDRPGVGGARGDALHLIGVNPQTHQATMLDIPRDTRVPIPGHRADKINVANEVGGPRLTADVVGALVGVKVQYAIQTNFDGFTGMISDLGGLQVDIPVPMKDLKYSGANFNAGPARLTGAQALAFARNRHQWPSGDVQRSVNQGILILAALAQVRSEHGGLAGSLEAMASLARHTRIDGLGLRELYGLGRLAIGINPGDVRNLPIPVTGGPGSDLVVTAEAQSLFADFADDGVLQSH